MRVRVKVRVRVRVKVRVRVRVKVEVSPCLPFADTTAIIVCRRDRWKLVRMKRGRVEWSEVRGEVGCRSGRD
jgi:hypothetical protein